MLLLSTSSLKGYGVNRIFYFIKEAGYDGLELAVDETYDTHNGPYLKALVGQYQLPIAVVKAPANLDIKSANEVIDLAKEVGANLLVLEPPRLLDFKFNSWIKRELPKIAKHFELNIALLNAPDETILGFIPAHSVSSVADLKKFGPICLDTSRLASRKEDILHVLNLVGGHVVHIRLSNVRRSRDYCLPQEGSLPLESFLDRLKKGGYQHDIALSVRPTELKAGNDEKVLQILQEVKKFYEEHFS
jgi:sugar phosphate isomerase/epimerase